MTYEEVMKRAKAAGERAVEELKEDKSMTPNFFLIDNDKGETALVSVAGDVMNSLSAKRGLAERVRVLIKEGGYKCVVFVSDTYALKLGPGDAEKVQQLRAAGVYSLKAIAEEWGIGELDEKIRVLVQGSHNFILSWSYQRDSEGTVVKVEEMEVESEYEQIGGIFSFYEEASSVPN